VPIKLLLDLLHLRGREDLFEEAALLQPLAKEPAKAVQDGIRNHDAEQLRPHHVRELRDPLEHEEPSDQEDDFFRRAGPERAEKEQEEDAEVALPLQVLRHHLQRRLVEKGERERHRGGILAASRTPRGRGRGSLFP
jgi:hypothetical protein